MTMIAPWEELVLELLAAWRAASAEPRAGASLGDVRAFEDRYGIRLPDEFKTYIRRANGMSQGDMDSERLIRFYAIDEVKPIAVDAGAYVGYFAIADFMIGSHEYAIALAGDQYGKVAIVDDTGPPRIVAESFVEFIDQYLHAPETIWNR